MLLLLLVLLLALLRSWRALINGPALRCCTCLLCLEPVASCSLGSWGHS
jgi:hypothetical protein